MRTQNYLQKSKENEEKVAAAMQKKQEEMKLKRTLEVIKEGDKKDNIERVNKQQEYKRQKLLEKINRDNEMVARMK